MQIPIVNEQDEIIGYKDRNDRNPEDIMRVTAIWITDENGDILLQRRKLTKKLNPGKWSQAVGGTVEEGETYESNAYKEMEEEIGVKGVKLSPHQKFYGYPGASIGKRFCQLFVAEIPRSTVLVPCEEEVEELKWVTKEELNKMIEEDPKNFIGLMQELKNIFL